MTSPHSENYSQRRERESALRELAHALAPSSYAPGAAQERLRRLAREEYVKGVLEVANAYVERGRIVVRKDDAVHVIGVCDQCDGSGTVERWSSRFQDREELTCPKCDGDAEDANRDCDCVPCTRVREALDARKEPL